MCIILRHEFVDDPYASFRPGGGGGYIFAFFQLGTCQKSIYLGRQSDALKLFGKRVKAAEACTCITWLQIGKPREIEDKLEFRNNHVDGGERPDPPIPLECCRAKVRTICEIKDTFRGGSRCVMSFGVILRERFEGGGTLLLIALSVEE